jgi:hypothetical protein
MSEGNTFYTKPRIRICMRGLPSGSPYCIEDLIRRPSLALDKLVLKGILDASGGGVFVQSSCGENP